MEHQATEETFIHVQDRDNLHGGYIEIVAAWSQCVSSVDEHIPKTSEVRASYGGCPQAIGKLGNRFFADAPSDATKSTICVASTAYGYDHPDGECSRLCKPYEVAQHVSYPPPGAPRADVPLIGRESFDTISQRAARMTQGCP